MWKQTHIIQPGNTPVMAADGHNGGTILYTEDEWLHDDTADYELAQDGTVTFQGNIFGYVIERQ